ncbi:MAG: hypothetical protein QOD57_3213 [Actinomycetota bacterium]|nr:hypothetical protein [Actinomycetota bacterium]MDQ1500630.1 hypothetical protein [Actinomycetota bacterium]MDQ1505486.1 hypothetical protein [Actinomycetota bacterium]MDQ1565663.1 hypothetical protein [Actinomycetota bacterium]
MSTAQADDSGPEFDPTLVADGPATVAGLVLSSGRPSQSTPLRRTFVQPAERDRQPTGGPLAALVRHRDRRALILYLLVLTMASTEPWDARRDSRIWARALDVGGGRSGREAVSKALRRLRGLQLIVTSRVNRLSAVTMLREDGSGEPYTYPTPDQRQDRYLRLPFAFWTDRWYQRLNLPAVAMLLVLLAEKDGVVLPLDRISTWYGISRATAQRGLAELESHGLLQVRTVQRAEPLAPLGFTYDRHHHLQGVFERSRPGRPEENVTELKPTAAKRRRLRRKLTATEGKEVIAP